MNTIDSRSLRRVRPARSRLAGRWWLAAVLLLPALSASQQPPGAEVTGGTTQLRNGVWYLDARIDYRLSTEAVDALENGVPLSFELQIDLMRERRLLPNAPVASLRQDYELSWQPVARSYLIRNMHGGEQRTHSTLGGALQDLGRIVDLPLIDAALLEPASYIVSLRVRLDQGKLPGPLRLLAFWKDGLNLDSDWHRWRLAD